MPGLVTKFKFLPPEKRAGGYLQYIATREGVEKLAGSKTYADYIATRPRAERFGSHGLFTDSGVEVKLSKVSEELNRYEGNVYTAILSLRREDAARLGFDTGARWRDMLRTQTQALAESLKIPIGHLRWYAAFHNEGHHPHVHLIAYSEVPGEGYLSPQGVEKLRSAIARDIFSEDLVSVYAQQTAYRDALRRTAREQAAALVDSIHRGGGENPVAENLLRQLSRKLNNTSGKKVYAYLPPDAKHLVDEIVAELSKDENISALYDLWYSQREEVLRTYTDELPPRVPLTGCPAFRPVKNAVIQAAAELADDPPPTHAPVLPASLRLLRQLAQALQEQIDRDPRQQIRIDRKLRRRIDEKKQALGMRIE